MTMQGVVRNNFSPVTARFKFEAKLIVEESMRKTLRALTVEAQKIARENLKRLVYDAPPPRSVQDGHWTEADYMASRRLGIVWNAIMLDGPTTVEPRLVNASVRVDMATVQGNPNTNEAFYYAWILNKGTTNRINYVGRPFWTAMVRVMKNFMLPFGIKGLKNAKLGLLGQDGWQDRGYVEAEFSV